MSWQLRVCCKSGLPKKALASVLLSCVADIVRLAMSQASSPSTSQGWPSHCTSDCWTIIVLTPGLPILGLSANSSLCPDVERFENDLTLALLRWSANLCTADDHDYYACTLHAALLFISMEMEINDVIDNLLLLRHWMKSLINMSDSIETCVSQQALSAVI